MATAGEPRKSATSALGTLVAIACVVGCSHASAKPVSGPDGERGWFAISCDQDGSHCEEKAREVCLDGYDIMDTSGHHGVAAVPTDREGEYRGRMLIKCKRRSAD